MRPLFPKWFNGLAKFTAIATVGAPALIVGLLLVYARSDPGLRRHIPIAQPIQFDHRHHVADEGIECRYCHQTVEKSAYAGMPPVSLCMNCHSQIWNKSPYLETLRQAYFTGKVIKWKQVHNLSDYVYFNHAIHVNKGVGCETCHGRIDTMAAVYKDKTLTMSWCLDCHRNPGPNLRPREAITQMNYQPDPSQTPEALAQSLLGKYDVHTRVSCSTCHR